MTEEEHSNLYKLINNLNLVADMKKTFERLYDEVSTLLTSLTLEEKQRLRVLVVPDYVVDDLESGLGEFWAESASSYEPINLENID